MSPRNNTQSASGKMNTPQHDINEGEHDIFDDFELIERDEVAEHSDEDFELVEPYAEQRTATKSRQRTFSGRSRSSSVETQAYRSVVKGGHFNGSRSARPSHIVAAPPTPEPGSPATVTLAWPKRHAGFRSPTLEEMLEQMRLDDPQPSNLQPVLTDEPVPHRKVVGNARMLDRRVREMGEQLAIRQREMAKQVATSQREIEEQADAESEGRRGREEVRPGYIDGYAYDDW